MSDARRYRLNAAECSIGGQNLRTTYRGSLLAISAAWYALAVQDEEIERLLAQAEPAPALAPGTAEILAFPISARSFVSSAGCKTTPGLSAPHCGAFARALLTR
jgi:hypothetical protein